MSDKPPLSNVGPGDTIPLDRITWNAMIGAGREYARSHPGFGAPALPGGPTVPQTLVLVENATGADLDAFAVLAVAGTPPVSVVDRPHDVRQMPVLSGSTPAASTNAFAVLIEPVADGEIGRAAVLGVVPVSIHINDATHAYAAPGTSTSYLESAASGPAKILWKESSGTTRKALVLLQGDYSAGVTGSGTDNHVVRWDGTSAIQDSYSQIADDGTLTLANKTSPSVLAASGDPVVRAQAYTSGSTQISEVRLVPYGTDTQVSITAAIDPGVSASFSIAGLGAGDTGFVFGVTNTASGGLNYNTFDTLGRADQSTVQSNYLALVGKTNIGYLEPAGVTDPGNTAILEFEGPHGSPYSGTLYAIIPSTTGGRQSTFFITPNDSTNSACYAIESLGVTYGGVTAALAPGMQFVGGIAVTAGSGSFVTTGANTFTDTQTIHSGASVPALELQQTSSDASNTLQVKNIAGSVTFAVTGAGDVTATSFSGAGSGLTGLNASNLASGTVPYARLPRALFSRIAAYG